MTTERVLDVYCTGEDIKVVTATDDPASPRHVTAIGLRIFFETAELDDDGDHAYYYGADIRCRVHREYVTSKREWVKIGKRIREFETSNARSFLGLKPEIAWMIQNNVRLGDNFNLQTRRFSEGGDTLIPLRVLAFDLETTSLDPTLPTAHILTIAAILLHVYGDRIEYVKKWVGQLGTMNARSPFLEKHRAKHPRCPLIVRTFPCPVSLVAAGGLEGTEGMGRVLAAEGALVGAFETFLRESDADLVMVCVSPFFRFFPGQCGGRS
jgi:hypothetical protein